MRKVLAVSIGLLALLAAGTAAPAQESLLPPGPGRAEVIAACSDCHGLSAVLHNHLTADEWRDTIAQMQMEGSYIPEQNIPAMVQYLTAHWPPPEPPVAAPPPGPAAK